jgi:hypothetical protein
MEALLHFRFHVIVLSINDENIDCTRSGLLSTDARWQREVSVTSAKARCHWSNGLSFAQRKDWSKTVLLKRIPMLLFVARSETGIEID